MTEHLECCTICGNVTTQGKGSQSLLYEIQCSEEIIDFVKVLQEDFY